MDVWYEVLAEEGLDLIEPLWLQLRQMHQTRSTYFKETLGARTFQDHREELLEKAAEGLMRVELVRDMEGRLVAYCVSTIDPHMTGEVDSIFVAIGFRGLGIGTRLMEGSMSWMDGLGVRRKVIGVIVGNESVYGYYARFGFKPKNVILEHAPNAGARREVEQPIK